MRSIVDLIEKRYFDIAYPEGKGGRVDLIRDIANTNESNLKTNARYAQVIMNIFGDQVALLESLDNDHKSLILSWVAKNWQESDIEYVDLLVTIITNLELNSAREFLYEKLIKTLNTDVKGILEDGLSEF